MEKRPKARSFSQPNHVTCPVRVAATFVFSHETRTKHACFVANVRLSLEFATFHRFNIVLPCIGSKGSRGPSVGLGAEATMALVPYDPGGAGVRPPGPGAGPAGVLVAAGPAPGAAAAAVAAGICPRHGGAYDKECSTCIWYKKKDQWLPELQYTHPRNPGVSISSIEAKIGPDGMVRVGCPACALQNKQCAFALFAIIEPSMFQLCAFRKHHRCDKHIRCVAAFFCRQHKQRISQIPGVPSGAKQHHGACLERFK